MNMDWIKRQRSCFVWTIIATNFHLVFGGREYRRSIVPLCCHQPRECMDTHMNAEYSMTRPPHTLTLVAASSRTFLPTCKLDDLEYAQAELKWLYGCKFHWPMYTSCMYRYRVWSLSWWDTSQWHLDSGIWPYVLASYVQEGLILISHASVYTSILRIDWLLTCSIPSLCNQTIQQISLPLQRVRYVRILNHNYVNCVMWLHFA